MLLIQSLIILFPLVLLESFVDFSLTAANISVVSPALYYYIQSVSFGTDRPHNDLLPPFLYYDSLTCQCKLSSGVKENVFVTKMSIYTRLMVV